MPTVGILSGILGRYSISWYNYCEEMIVSPTCLVYPHTLDLLSQDQMVMKSSHLGYLAQQSHNLTTKDYCPFHHNWWSLHLRLWCLYEPSRSYRVFPYRIASGCCDRSCGWTCRILGIRRFSNLIHHPSVVDNFYLNTRC